MLRSPRGARCSLAAALLLAFCGLAVAQGCAPRRALPPTLPSLPPARNVIVILVDTLRADHLPLYGYGRDTSPALASLARESLLFQSVRSQASCTFPSVNSLLTSRSATAFVGQPGNAMGLPAGIPGLAEILRGRGFHTVAVSASPVVRRSPSRFNPGGGFDRGFDEFQEDCLWKEADCVTDLALTHLARAARRPLFLYLHYLGGHGPYALPAGYPHRFAHGQPDKDFVRKGDPNPIASWLYKGAPNPGASAADLRYLGDLYDDKIAFFDAQLARLVDGLRAGGWLDDSIVVVAADHGEEFLEHGDVKHCRNLFDTTIRTPLLLRVPGAAPRTVAEPVENLDVVPTVLDLLGVHGAGVAAGAATSSAAGVAGTAAFEGRSLRPAVLGQPLPQGWQRSAEGALRSISDGRLKLVHDLGTKRFALYDLAADPGETRDVLSERRRDFHRLRDALLAWITRTEGAPAGDTVRHSADAERRLRSLGYLE
jgi:arylsulfatase A-like enzyme